MRILFVTPYLPSPPRFGGQRRLDGLMRELARTNEVSLLAFVDSEDSAAPRIAAARHYCRSVTVVPHVRHAASGRVKRALQAASLLTSISFERMAHTCFRLRSALADLLRAERLELVQFEFSQMAYNVTSDSRRVPCVLDEHNIEYDVIRRTAVAEGAWARRRFHRANWPKLRAEERSIWRRCDGTAVTSERDRQLLLEDVPEARTVVVPNGVDIDEFAPDDRAPIQRDTVLFFGAINYHPNTDGVLFFLREVLPILKRRNPKVRFSVVGQEPPSEIAKWSDPSVDVVGYVDDIRPHVARAAAVVVPLRIGGGTRLKVLEAMAMAKPVVSTSLGVEGIDVVNGRNAIVADGADALAEALATVLESDLQARSLGRCARDLVVSRYSWRSSAARLAEFHADIVERRRALREPSRSRQRA